MIKEFNKSSNYGFNFFYEDVIQAGETTMLRMPTVTPNKRGVNDIGFAYENGITIYATLSDNPESDNAIWQELMPFDEINKTTSFLKIVNSGTIVSKVNIRAILN